MTTATGGFKPAPPAACLDESKVESRTGAEFPAWMVGEAGFKPPPAASDVMFPNPLSPDNSPSASRIALNPNDVKHGLGRIVLTLVELLRELLERQAIRRIEAESLTEDEVERLGTTFQQLAEQMERLKQEFGVTDEDLNIDLGPLGKLL